TLGITTLPVQESGLAEFLGGNGRVSTGRRRDAETPRGVYLDVCNLRTTAISSQQFWRGHRAQSAHTLRGKCPFSASTKPSLWKNAGLRVSASTSAIPLARASATKASIRARPTPAPC